MSFPQDFVDLLESEVKNYMETNGYVVVQRACRIGDPERTIGIFCADWTPDMQSIEIGLRDEPSLQTYSLTLQLQVKHSDAQEGNAIFTKDAKTLRTVLYRAPGLRVGFQGLSETLLGSRERFLRFGVRKQQFLNAPVQNGHVFMATTAVWVQTETIQL